jgi:hypothetical protein
MTGVEPCPVILPGPGKVVLTTFHHASSDLIDLYLSPQPPTGSLAAKETAVDALLYPQVSRASVVDQAWERIGVTGNHPIWSEDRHDYVAAMDLRVGERLKNLSGDTVWVQQKLPRPGPTPVYNLEVQDEHVYYVGANGVLAHNAGEDCGDGNGSHAVKLASDLYTQVRPGTKAWRDVVNQISTLGKGKVNVRVRTATEAKQLLKEARGNMNRYKQYTRDGRGPHRNYRKGYETHNDHNLQELEVGNNLPHIKWFDGKSSGHIFYDIPN